MHCSVVASGEAAAGVGPLVVVTRAWPLSEPGNSGGGAWTCTCSHQREVCARAWVPLLSSFGSSTCCPASRLRCDFPRAVQIRGEVQSRFYIYDTSTRFIEEQGARCATTRADRIFARLWELLCHTIADRPAASVFCTISYSCVYARARYLHHGVHEAAPRVEPPAQSVSA